MTKLAYACGGVVIAGLLYLVLALVIKLVGVKRVMRFLPPVVTGPIIICIGLTLAGSAISNASTNWLIAVVALAVIIVFNIWGKGMFKIIPILMGVLIAYVFALILNAVRHYQSGRIRHSELLLRGRGRLGGSACPSRCASST